MKNALLTFFVITTIALGGYVLKGTSEGAADLSSLETEQSKPITTDGDIAIGNNDAKVEVIEYLGYDCKECADFHNQSFEQFKKDYIDSGKVKFTIRDFITNQNALFTAMLTKCAAEDKKFELAQAMLATQQSWIKEPVPFKSLRELSAKYGFTDSSFYSCIENSKLALSVITNQQRAYKQLNVSRTPSFIVNGQKLERFNGVADLQKAIESVLSGGQANETFWKDAEELSKLSPQDHFLGNIDAPVTIIEYASLSCPHCAEFHKKTLPDLKRDFIDTGKAKLIFRNYPLNPAAVNAAVLAECAGKEKYFENLALLFGNQDWAYKGDFKMNLKNLSPTLGLSEEQYANCVANKELENNIFLSANVGATKLGVDSTPAFFINGKKFEKAYSYDEFKKALEAAK